MYQFLAQRVDTFSRKIQSKAKFRQPVLRIATPVSREVQISSIAACTSEKFAKSM